MSTTIHPDMYVMARRGYACVRLLPTVDVTVCGRLGDGPAVFDDSTSPRYVRQHCTACTTVRCDRVECSRTAEYTASPYGTPERLCRWHSEFHARTPLTV
jgi:hypothetical protein